MRKCPFCLAEIDEKAKVCKACNSTVVKKCTACNAEILATARKCRYCAADLEAKPLPAVRVSTGPLGSRREILTTLVLVFLTCGLWGLVLQYKIGSEINEHRRRNDFNPGLDLALVFLTCGLWVFYIMVKYPQALQEMIVEEGGHSSDLVLPSILLTIFGLHIVALMILQGELNRHWELHGAPRT
ncbi:MAG: DUF4234 domain-containing protein [Planctomycetaceae bacterium]|nr:DUF4234 domain-containing protein [Planctomycetaceae bacterium]